VSTTTTSPLSAITEKDWMRTVLEGFTVNGWWTYHAHDSRRSQPGFPDVVAVHAPTKRVVFVELKTERGRLTADQYDWRDELIGAGQEWFLWRPSSWAEAEAVMRGKRYAP
jgi:hypothetical protein